MSLPECRVCGTTDPQRMIALMTLWFGAFAELEPDLGYFHLCPACYEALIEPHLDEVVEQVAQLHPEASRRARQEGALHADAEPAGAADAAAGGSSGDAASGGSSGDAGETAGADEADAAGDTASGEGPDSDPDPDEPG